MITGCSPAVLVRMFTLPPMPSASMLAWSVLLISIDSTRSDASVSSLICRTPVSGDGTLTPSIVRLLSRGSVPRIWTYLPSPSSRSSVTLGSRPSASAMFAFGRLVITSADSTWTMLSAVRSRLI